MAIGFIRSIFLIFIGCFISEVALCGQVQEPINIKVKFDKTFYSVSYDTKVFVYKEGPNIFSILIKDCNKSLMNKITSRYQSLLSEYKRQKNQSPTAFDVKLINSSGSTIQITRGSTLGLWLRELPKKIMYHKAEAEVMCKK